MGMQGNGPGTGQGLSSAAACPGSPLWDGVSPGELPAGKSCVCQPVGAPEGANAAPGHLGLICICVCSDNSAGAVLRYLHGHQVFLLCSSLALSFTAALHHAACPPLCCLRRAVLQHRLREHHARPGHKLTARAPISTATCAEHLLQLRCVSRWVWEELVPTKWGGGERRTSVYTPLSQKCSRSHWGGSTVLA